MLIIFIFFSLLMAVRGNFVDLYAMSVIPFVGKKHYDYAKAAFIDISKSTWEDLK